MRKTQFGVLSSTSFTSVAKPSAISPIAIVPIAKVSAVASPTPILTTPLTPETSPSRYTPSTDNPVGAATQLYQSVAKAPAYQGNLQIPTITMPGAGGLKGTSGPSASPAPSTSPAPSVPVAPPAAYSPSPPSPDQIPPISYGAAPSAPDTSQQGYSGYSPPAPAMSDPTPATVAANSPLAVPPAPPISTPGTASTALATTTSSPTVSVSIWTRILRFFGFSKAPAPPTTPATIHGEEPITTQEQGAVALVRRARAGDQNAMATLDLIGKNARAGNARAKRSYDLCMAYCKAHPVGADMGGEGGSWDDIEESITYWPEGSKSDPLMAEAVKLSFGPPLTNDAIIGYASTTFGAEEEVYAFAEGMRHAAPIVGDQGASWQGAVVGIARRLQQARLPGANLGLLDPRLVAEIGG